MVEHGYSTMLLEEVAWQHKLKNALRYFWWKGVLRSDLSDIGVMV
jgi:hypothetical protein